MLNKSYGLRVFRTCGTLPAGPLITKTHIHIMVIIGGSLELNRNWLTREAMGLLTSWPLTSSIQLMLNEIINGC